MTGFINIWKGSGINSTWPVAQVKKKLGVKCGHMGTLDPLACGVLPIGLGQTARLFDYLLDKEKTYVAEFSFGSTTDTLDSAGKVTASGGRIPKEEEIMSVLGDFCGEIDQVPPKYSAKLVDGRRGYALARQGVEFELPPKKVVVKDISIIAKSAGGAYFFRIVCKGGTYIRSLARDIASSLGTYAYMSALSRTQSGCFNRGNSVILEDLLDSDDPYQYIIPADAALDFPKIHLSFREYKRLVDGIFGGYPMPDGLYRLYCGRTFFGVGEISRGILKVRTYVRDENA